MSAKTLEPAHSFFYAPDTLASPNWKGAENAMARVDQYVADPPNDRQRDAISQSFKKRLSMLWGPPGTGKTATLAALVLSWLELPEVAGRGMRVCIGASNYNAIDNVLESCAQLLVARRTKIGRLPASVIRLRADSAAPCTVDGVEDLPAYPARSRLQSEVEESQALVIVGGTHQQLIKLTNGKFADEIGAPLFDLLVIDEASQVQSASALTYMCLLRGTAHVVVCGDDRQLGPVYQYKVEDSRSGLLDCIFTYYRTVHGIQPVSLAKNYRSNEVISGWPSVRFYEREYESHNKTRRLPMPARPVAQPHTWPKSLQWTEALAKLLDPEAPLTVVVYDERTSTVSNLFEAQIAASIVHEYAATLAVANRGKFPEDLWEERVGLVTPHRAQIATIRNLIGEELAAEGEGVSFIDTVDRFQGQERDLIVASYTVSDPDFIASEEEFILDPRRFNVTLTRARMKFIMLISRSLLVHLPNDEKVAQGAAHLQLFPEVYCSSAGELKLPFRDPGGKVVLRRCELYTRQFAPVVGRST